MQYFREQSPRSDLGTINEIPLDQIEANPNQPRREFDDEALHELAESIKAPAEQKMLPLQPEYSGTA